MKRQHKGRCTFCGGSKFIDCVDNLGGRYRGCERCVVAGAKLYPWRIGRKVGRAVYAQLGAEPSDHDVPIGMFDTADLASAAVDAHSRMIDEDDK